METISICYNGEVYGTVPFDQTCPVCHKPYFYVGDVPTGGFIEGSEPWCTCSQIAIAYPYPPSEPVVQEGWKGWICPRCGTGVSPFTSICPCNKQTLL